MNAISTGTPPTHVYVATRDGVCFATIADIGGPIDTQLSWLRGEGFGVHRVTASEAAEMLGQTAGNRPISPAIPQQLAPETGLDDATLVTVEEGHEISKQLGLKMSLSRFRTRAPELGFEHRPNMRRIYMPRGKLIRALLATEPTPQGRRAEPVPVPSRKRSR